MLNFIVLGQVPGTSILFDFSMLVNLIGGFVCAWLCYLLAKRAIHRGKDAFIEFMTLELISL